MLKFNAANFVELQEEVNQRSHEVSVAIIRGICSALAAGVDYVEVGHVAEGGISIGVKREDFLNTLRLNLERCQEAEEYELCAEAVKWIDKISREQ